MRPLVLDEICRLPGRGLELGALPDGRLHAITGDTELHKPGLLGCTWSVIDLAGETFSRKRFDGPLWLPICWKDHLLTSITESRSTDRGHTQHRSRLVLLETDRPETIDEFAWECYADRPAVIGDHLWIGVSRGMSQKHDSFAWRWDGDRDIRRFPIGRKMDWVSTPIALSAGVLGCEVESFLAKEQQACAACFLADGAAIAKSPWIPSGGGELAGRVLWVRDRLWVHTSRGALECFRFEGRSLVRQPVPGFLGPATGLSKDAPGRLEIYALLGPDAAAAIDPEIRIEWVVPLERGALIGGWSFRKFAVRRIRPDGRIEAELTIDRGGVAFRRPIRHPLAGLVSILSDGRVVSISEDSGTTTDVVPVVAP
ncbi:MAG: hypothetical protein HUU15_00445 [Candidatus Brocadiae bacterium]|nr:hypothetical protein [Candidatus Brocadiia bacterium]